jgi:hypothetical protein
VALPGLRTHRKFLALTRRLGNNPVLAIGHLELLWLCANESGNPSFRNAEQIECAAEWFGEAGKLAADLADVGFLDRAGEGFEIHDYFDHAPRYVRDRAARAEARHAAGVTLSDLRRQAVSQRKDRLQPSTNELQAPPFVYKPSDSQHPTPSTHGKEREPSPSAPTRAPRRPKQTDPDFVTFYAQFPKHEARAEAELAWWQTRDRRPPLADVLAALALIDTSEPRFIPRAATWLRAGRWADEKPRNGTPAPQPQRTAYNDRAKQLLSEADAVEKSDPELAQILREEAGWRGKIGPAPIQVED